MNYQEFNADNCKNSRVGLPTVSFNRKSGGIHLSRRTCDQHKLDVGDKISFLQDQDNPQNWTIKRNTENGFVLRKTSATYGLAFHSSILSNRILDALKYKERSAKILVANEPDDHGFIPLITKSINTLTPIK
jgi:hypothetical protein